MDLRYERLRYYRQLSERLGRGMICHDAWHVWGCYAQRREDRYKKINRETIRKWPSRVGAVGDGRSVGDHRAPPACADSSERRSRPR